MLFVLTQVPAVPFLTVQLERLAYLQQHCQHGEQRVNVPIHFALGIQQCRAMEEQLQFLDNSEHYYSTSCAESELIKQTILTQYSTNRIVKASRKL